MSFTSPELVWTLIIKLPHTEVKFCPEVKSQSGLSSLRVSCERALSENMSRKYWENFESKFDGFEKRSLFFEDSKWQHKLVRDYSQGKLNSYFLNNAAKTCLYELKISDSIEHVFQSTTFSHLSNNLHTSCLSAFNSILKNKLQNRSNHSYFETEKSLFK